MRYFIILLLLLTVQPVNAEWHYGAYIGFTNFESQKATNEGIDTVGYSIGMQFERISESRKFASAFGVAYLDYGDYRSFYQRQSSNYFSNYGCYDYDCRRSYRRSGQSNASALHYFINFGPRYKLGRSDTWFSPQIGLSDLTGSERAVPNCSSCYREKINIDSGAYWQLNLITPARRNYMKFQYNKFFDDKGMQSTFNVVYMF